MATPDQLRTLADLLDDNDVFDLVAGAITDVRDKWPRHASDVDSAELLDEVIVAVRAAADGAS